MIFFYKNYIWIWNAIYDAPPSLFDRKFTILIMFTLG